MINIASAFVTNAREGPDRPCIVTALDETITYGELLHRMRQFAAAIRGAGVGPGERVVLTFPNSVELLVAYFGSLMAGATAVLVDYRSKPGHLDFVRDNCGARLWVSPENRSAYAHIPDHFLFPAELDAFTPLPDELVCAEQNPLALIMYTSGATGTPKGVRLLHDNLVHTRRAIIEWSDARPGTRELMALSLTHLFGLARCQIHFSLGGTIYLEPGFDNFLRILERVRRYEIQSLPNTPSGIRTLRAHFESQFVESARSLRWTTINSAPLEAEHIGWYRERAPDIRFFMYYGLTEASRSTYICYNDHPDKDATVGTGAPGTEVRVGTSDSPLVGEVGEVLLRGANVTPGYWGMDSAPFFDDGWFRTGDLGVMDDAGFLTWVGRLKEQINVDGLKVNPAEVEAVLSGHPAVKDCAVVGDPDALKGQVVVAYVVAEADHRDGLALELRRRCRKALEAYKIPRRVEFVDAIPRTDSGKPKRFLLSDRSPR